MDEHSTRGWIGVLVSLAVLVGSATGARAHWMFDDSQVPADRLLTNIQRNLEKSPKNAKAYFALARVHSYLYASESDQINASLPSAKDDALPKFAPTSSVRPRRDDPALTPAAFEHLRLSLDAYRKAVELAPKEPLYRLGYGWMLGEAAKGSALEPISQPTTHTASTQAAVEATSSTTAPSTAPSTPEQFARRALEQYDQVVALALDADLKRGMYLQGIDTPVSHEAADNGLALMQQFHIDDAVMLKRFKDASDSIEKLPSAITPIVLPLDEARTLESLIDGDATTTFDLAGDDIPRRWPWVKPDTAVLVWQPTAGAPITSGRQLFGSSTWWILWQNGYDALAALDDDDDGELSGSELNHIGVWRDANANGNCDAGEVVPVSTAGITAIATTFARDAAGNMSNAKGVRMSDGRVLPTYDWTPTSLPFDSKSPAKGE